MSEKWFYDTKTGQVSQGKESGWDSRMGPYDTREEAAAALETAKKRNEQADAYDAGDED